MIVCADDFGLAPDINRAIIELAEAGRVTAVSVMAALPSVASRDIRPLLELGGKIDLGLHLTLTPDKGAMPTRPSTIAPGGRFHTYGSLVFQSMSGQINSSDCAAEITAQYNLFVEKTGRPPDFIDGHKHVHQFAGIREGLLKFVQTLPKDARPYVRNTNADFMEILKLRMSFIKQIVIATPGGVMKERLKGEGILTNDGFAGVYDFRLSANYPVFLRRFVKRLAGRANGLLMAHPGLDEPWRRAEYEGLREADCLGRVSRFVPPARAR